MVNEYYQKHKEKFRKEACEKCQNLSEEEIEKKCQYHCECNNNLSEEDNLGI